MTWRTPRTPPKVQGQIDFYAAIERANGKHPAPDHPSKGESNMSNDQWKWWVGHDEERYTTECDSREEAVQIAKEEFEGAYIVEAIQANNIRLSEYFDAATFMENADEKAWDDHGDPEGDGPVFETTTPDQGKDLEAMVRAAIDAWQTKHSLRFKGWRFSASRNEEYIPADETEDA